MGTQNIMICSNMHYMLMYAIHNEFNICNQKYAKVCKKICKNMNLPEITPRISIVRKVMQNMQKTCEKYAKNMQKYAFTPRISIVRNIMQNMRKICKNMQKYAKCVSMKFVCKICRSLHSHFTDVGQGVTTHESELLNPSPSHSGTGPGGPGTGTQGPGQ